MKTGVDHRHSAALHGQLQYLYRDLFVLTGGGPGNSTTLLSIDLVKIALGQFDSGSCCGDVVDLLSPSRF